LPLETLVDLESQLIQGSNGYYMLQIAMGTNVVSIIMKLFKAFGANARLQLVTNTLMKASEDLFHFGVVFGALFIGASLIGHILFGEDMEEFRSFGISINTSFESLLGDFDWYSDRVISKLELGSGLPFWVVVVWFYVYMVFVVLVMMNMLLAIVMDHYMNLVNEIKGDAENAPALWTQSRRMMKRMHESKGYMPGSRLLHALEDLGEHPDNPVTAESMKTAFPKMPDKQIEGQMTLLQKHAKKMQGEIQEDEQLRTLSDIKKGVLDLADQVRIVAHTCCRAVARIETLENRVGQLLGTNMNGEKIDKDSDSQKPTSYEDYEKLAGDVREMLGVLKEQQRQANEKQREYELHPKTIQPQIYSRQLPVMPATAAGNACCGVTPSPPEQQVHLAQIQQYRPVQR